MKRLIAYSLILFVFLSCGVDQNEFKQIKNERDQLLAQVQASTVTINALRDSIAMLSFPPDQRLNKINKLISSGDYMPAKDEISHLICLFPSSKETEAASSLSAKIDRLIAQKKAEEERMMALGFKALKASTTTTIDYNRVDFSSISVGSTFTFDSYGDHYYYRTADKGSKYITASMRITSGEKNPRLPQLAVYRISGDRMLWEGNFTTEFARWDDYGSYLGNYHDNGNDFAKTNTVRFKIGVEVSEDVVKGAYALVLKKENSLSREYEKYSNPPVSYSGRVDYPITLRLNDFNQENSQFIVIKISNL